MTHKLFGMTVSPDVYALNAHQRQPKRRTRSAPTPKRSPLEAKFAQAWMILGGPHLCEEYDFHKEREWRFDFAHPAKRIAIECEGGTRKYGRHNRHEGYRGDCEKYNAATLDGWRVFRLTSDMINPDHIEPIIELVRSG